MRCRAAYGRRPASGGLSCHRKDPPAVFRFHLQGPGPDGASGLRLHGSDGRVADDGRRHARGHRSLARTAARGARDDEKRSVGGFDIGLACHVHVDVGDDGPCLIGDDPYRHRARRRYCRPR